jgi:iron complex outermembrane recepter protein
MAAPGAQPAAELVITASGTEQRLFDTPYAVGVVDAPTAAQRRADGQPVEALARVPGLVVSTTAHNYAQDLQISSRGFGARASFGVRGMRLYADGIPASGPDGQGQVSHFDLAGAQRVEVLRGPFSALYGNSSGGVISLVSAAPTSAAPGCRRRCRQPRPEAVRVGVEAPLDGGFSLRASRLAASRSTASARTARPSARWATCAWAGTARTTASSSCSRPPGPAGAGPAGPDRAQFEADPDQTTRPRPRSSTRARATRQDAGRPELAPPLRSPARCARASSRLHRPACGDAVAGHPRGPRSDPRHGGRRDRLRPPLQRRRRPAGLALGAGGRARRSWWPAPAPSAAWTTAAATRTSPAAAPTRCWASPARCGATSATASQPRPLRAGRGRARAALERPALGLRSGRVDFRSATATSPPATATTRGPRLPLHQPGGGAAVAGQPALALYLSAGRGFESPTFGELAYRPDGTGFNSALKAQTSRQWELGAKWRPAARALSLDAAVFRIDTDDEIGVATSSGGRTTFQQRRAARAPGRRARPALAHRRGLARAGWRPAGSTRAIAADGRRGAGRPPHRRHAARSGYAELAWLPAGGIELALEARAQGRVPVNDPTATSPPASACWRCARSGSARPAIGRSNCWAASTTWPDRRVVGSVIVNEGNQRFFEPAPGRGGLLAVRWSAGFSAPRSAAPRRPGSGDSGGAVRLMIAGVVDATCVAWPCRGCRQPAGGGALTPKPVSLQFAEPKRSQFDHDHRPRRRSQDPPLGAAFARRARRGNHHHAPRRAGGPTRGSGCARRCEGGRRRPA